MFDFIDMDFGQPEAAVFNGPYLPEASECLSCGLCVSQCPTYRLFGTEEETPRRRVRTLSNLLSENRPISAGERRHLDNCLQCRACESACPSRMAYGQAFDKARMQLGIVPNRLAKLALWLIENKRWLKRLMPLLAMYLKSGLQMPLRKSGLLKQLKLESADALITRPDLQPIATRYPAKTERRGRVGLFTGCLAESFDRETLTSAIGLLNALGYEVLVPDEQNCCGAIHQHNGQPAGSLINRNIEVFSALDVEAVVFTASGCGAMLKEYAFPGSDRADNFAERLHDIHDFLLSQWPDDLQLNPAGWKIAVHEPCSQRNGLKNQQAVYSLLEKIPGITAAPLSDNQLCCGAGGSYMLTHPDNAHRLREMKYRVMADSEADFIVSSNFGCSVFLNAGLSRVRHPVWLLYRQLECAGK